MWTFGDGEAVEQCLKGGGEAVGNFGTNTRKLHEFSELLLGEDFAVQEMRYSTNKVSKN